MSLVPLQIPPGLERNGTAYETPDRWYDMNLMRWQSGSVKPIGGWQYLSTVSGAVRKIFVWRTNDNSRGVLVGSDTKLYCDQGSYTDITPASFVPLSSIGVAGGFGTFAFSDYTFGTARATPSPIFSPYAFWTFGSWGQDVIACANSDGRILQYIAATPTVAPLAITGAPTGNTGIVVTDERHVMAIGTYNYPRRVAWCSREDLTDWNYASTTNSAGFFDLKVKTPLLKAVNVNEGVLIFSYSEIFLGTYIGQPYVYNFIPISDAKMLHPDSIATFNGKAVWMGRDSFQLYASGNVTALPCPIFADIAKDMDPIYGAFRTHAAHNGIFSEIWFWYPSVGQTECDRYVIWNYAENWWGWGALSRSAMASADVYLRPYMGGSDGRMYEHEYGYTNSGASLVGQRWLRSGALGIGSGDRFMEVNQLLAATKGGYGSTTFTFYGKNAPDGAERTFGPYTPKASGYTDTRVSARESCLKITAAVDDDWSVGKIRLDVRPGSAR